MSEIKVDPSSSKRPPEQIIGRLPRDYGKLASAKAARMSWLEEALEAGNLTVAVDHGSHDDQVDALIWAWQMFPRAAIDVPDLRPASRTWKTIKRVAWRFVANERARYFWLGWLVALIVQALGAVTS